MGILSLFRRKKAAPAVEERATPAAAVTRGAPAGAAPFRAVAGSVLLSPHVTEKATLREAQGHYVFRVVRGASKPAIRRAVERQFGVHVTAVRVVNVRGKVRRRGRIEGRTPGFRKAIVTLRSGERLELAQRGA